MKHALFVAILSGSLLFSSALAADEPQAVPLAKGQPAPFDGQLLSTELAIRLGMKAETCERRVGIEVTHAARLVQVDLDLCERKREIDAAARQAERELMTKAVDGAAVWYRDPVFVAATSVVLTAVVIVLARETVIER